MGLINLPADVVASVLQFFKRKELDELSFINRRFYSIISQYLTLTPFRILSELNVNPDFECSIRKNFRSHVETYDLDAIKPSLELKYVRFDLTKLEFPTDGHDEICLAFVEKLLRMTHIWSDQKLIVDSWPNQCSLSAHTTVFGDFARATQLAIKPESAIAPWPAFSFDYPSFIACDRLTLIYLRLDPCSIIRYLHQWKGAGRKDLCWVINGNTDCNFKALVEQIIKEFMEAVTPRPFLFEIIFRHQQSKIHKFQFDNALTKEQLVSSVEAVRKGQLVRIERKAIR
ncbi:hypothetical protein DdX_01793 [Ditylenchus destructor]|uniref:F-box domain-containing protein n=1 Tax=Ditylenchus destructor TaxID=166010 RepID=A0AAD4RDY4_9BILA|nr:hypothetical protein DdX_01793 [Ditylenchus destructor]